MAKEIDSFHELGQLIAGYFHQDMELEAGSIPEAISHFAGATDDATKAALIGEMDAFLERYHNNVEEEFRRRYRFDFTPDTIGQTVPEFFAMVRAILADPEDYHRFETSVSGADNSHDED